MDLYLDKNLTLPQMVYKLRSELIYLNRRVQELELDNYVLSKDFTLEASSWVADNGKWKYALTAEEFAIASSLTLFLNSFFPGIINEFNKINEMKNDGSNIYFYCYGDKPSIDIPINVKFKSKGDGKPMAGMISSVGYIPHTVIYEDVFFDVASTDWTASGDNYIANIGAASFSHTDDTPYTDINMDFEDFNLIPAGTTQSYMDDFAKISYSEVVDVSNVKKLQLTCIKTKPTTNLKIQCRIWRNSVA